MLLCMVILGGMGNLNGVILGGMCILFFDRVILAQSTQLVRGLGALLGSEVLMRADLSLWRWFFFGATLIIVMVLRPEGLFPSSPACRRATCRRRGGLNMALLEAHRIVKRFGGLTPSTS